MSDQSRASATAILRWAEALYIENILIENVREFMSWGPLGANKRPLKSKRGELFQWFIHGLQALSYNVEWRILNAANYGDPQTRERLFIMARRHPKKIRWPEPTHTADTDPDLFGERPRWRPAREIIDWSLPGESIFARKRPLAKATLERIAAGLQKFGGKHAEPFLVILRNHQNARSLDRPLPSMTTSGANFALCEPFVLGQQSCAAPRSVEQPLPTVATAGAISLVEPFLVRYQGNHKGKRDGNGRVSPFLVPFFGERNGQAPRCHSVDEPLPTVTGQGAGALVEPFIMVNRTHNAPKSLDDPLPTLCTGNHMALVEPFLTDLRGADRPKAPKSVDEPVPTITTHNGLALVEPFLVRYHGNGKAQPVTEPIGTLTIKDRFGLVTGDGNRYAVDIRFRMLQPHELARAMSFPDDYRFFGNREQRVKQIGNAVPVNLARALCRELIK